MADKKLNSVSSVTDAAYVYAETSNGEIVKISKADLASVVAGVFNLDARWKSISTMNDSSVTQLFNGFESIFNEASVYSLIAKGNTSGSEGALIMFKHNTSSASFGFACSRGFGSIAVRRNTDGNWYYKRIGY